MIPELTTSELTSQDLCDLSRLIASELTTAKATDLRLLAGSDASLPGWYQESSTWDLLMLQGETPIVAVSYVPWANGQDGELHDACIDAALGIAADTLQAAAHGLLQPDLRRACVFLACSGPHADRAPSGLSIRSWMLLRADAPLARSCLASPTGRILPDLSSLDPCCSDKYTFEPSAAKR